MRRRGPSPNRSVVLDVGACTHARQHKGLSREALSALSLGPHPVSVATIKRAETAQPVYLQTARRLAELLEVPLSQPLAHEGASVVPLAGEAPAISVLAFRWLGSTERGRYLADGLTEDLLQPARARCRARTAPTPICMARCATCSCGAAAARAEGTPRSAPIGKPGPPGA